MKKAALFSNEPGRTRTPRTSRHALLTGGLVRRGARVRRMVEALLREEGRWLDPERVALRALALAVVLREEGQAAADPCSAAILRQAVSELVAEEAWDVLAGARLGRSPGAAFYRALAHHLGLDAEATRATCAERNARPLPGSTMETVDSREPYRPCSPRRRPIRVAEGPRPGAGGP
jgi:hypothetical protein